MNEHMHDERDGKSMDTQPDDCFPSAVSSSASGLESQSPFHGCSLASVTPLAYHPLSLVLFFNLKSEYLCPLQLLKAHLHSFADLLNSSRTAGPPVPLLGTNVL